MPELKSCPFCGAEIKARIGMGMLTYFYCQNQECGAITSFNGKKRIAPGVTEAENPIENFNRRPSNWIPVAERLPENGETVLTYIKHNYTDDNFRAYRAYHYVDGCFIGMGNLCEVTHWCPLPEPPKEGEQHD